MSNRQDSENFTLFYLRKSLFRSQKLNGKGLIGKIQNLQVKKTLHCFIGEVVHKEGGERSAD